MEQAITKAIEGGYDRAYAEGKFGNPSMPRALVNASFLIDPEFWKCLGKQQGWGEKDVIFHNTRLHESEYYWKNMWHRFITHLSEGKSTDDFFKELLSGTDL